MNCETNMASNGTRERLLRINRRIKWNEAANSDILECKRQAQLLVNSENPPCFDNGRRKGYMWIMKGLWEQKGYGYLNLSEQNLRDQAAKLEKTLGNAGQKISESVGTRHRLSLIHISEPTRPERISYAVFCLKKKKT